MDLGEGLKKVFLAGVGAVATTAETAKEIVDDLVTKGELTVEQGKVLNEELKRRIKLRNTAKKGADALRKEADTALLEQKELERERQQLEKTLEELRKFTKERILSLKLFD